MTHITLSKERGWMLFISIAADGNGVLNEHLSSQEQTLDILDNYNM